MIKVNKFMDNPKYLDEAFEKICNQMLAVFIKKHKDYGKGNILDMGELGIAFRISEKFNRIKHLLTNQAQPANESIDDSWIDIAVYAVIALLLRKGWFDRLELSKK